MARRDRMLARSLLPLLLLLLLSSLLSGRHAEAQVVLDPDFSSDTVTSGEYAPGLNTEYLIRESYGRRAGENLFHRFSRFDIPTGESATFIEDSPGSGIRRVIAHVGGSSASQIDGVLRSTIPSADVYLFNARGVVFGPNARLDIAGSFHTSTAESIRFGDDVRFGEDELGAAVTLSAASPEAWGFLSAAPAEIAVRGARLEVADDAALSLVGGPLRIEGPGTAGLPNLAAPSGALELVAVGSPGEVAIDPTVVPDLEAFDSLADIALSSGAVIDASGVDDQTLVVAGGSLFVDDAQIFAQHFGTGDHPGRAVDIAMRDTIRFGSSSAGTAGFLLSTAFRGNASGGGPAPDVGNGGEVHMTADELRAEGDGTFLIVGNDCVGTFACSQQDQPGGAGGALEIDVDRFAIRNGARVIVQTVGPGTGSAATIRAREVAIGNDAGVVATTDLLSFNTGSFAEGTTPPEGANATGGDLTIQADDFVRLENGGQIRTVTQRNGAGGDIRIVTGEFDMAASDPTGTLRSIVATETEIASGPPAPSGTGRAGNIEISSSGDLRIERGVVSSAALAQATGRTGDIVLRAPNGTIEIATRGVVNSQVASGLGATTTLEARRVVAREGGSVQSTLEDEGRAGDIRVIADDIFLTGSAPSGGRSGLFAKPLSSGDSGSGSGGSILIDGKRLRIEDGATIDLSSIQFGEVGDLVIGATNPLDSVSLDNASIRAETTRGIATGGNISIDASRIRLDRGSTISSTNTGPGDAGTIMLNGRSLRILRGSEIETAAGSMGAGGNIDVRMHDSVIVDHSQIRTNTRGTTTTTEGGNIDIDAQVVILSSATLNASAPVGSGGRIRIVGGQFLSTPSTTLDATGGIAALDGVVQILSSETNMQNALPRPSVVFEDPTRRLATGCDARTNSLGSLYVLPRPITAPPGEFLDTSPKTPESFDLGREKDSDCGGLR